MYLEISLETGGFQVFAISQGAIMCYAWAGCSSRFLCSFGGEEAAVLQFGKVPRPSPKPIHQN